MQRAVGAVCASVAVSRVVAVEILGETGCSAEIDARPDAATADDGRLERLGDLGIAPAAEVLSQGVFDQPAERPVRLGY
jgi:hypothetical protein